MKKIKKLPTAISIFSVWIKPKLKIKKHKGFIYTLFVISFLSALMLFISIQKSAESKPELAEKIRADEVVSFVKSVSNDINRGLYISGKRAILSLDNHILEGTGTFAEEANISTVELMLNGTLNGEHSDIMENSTIINWTDALIAISNGQKMNAIISIESMSVVPASAFEVAVKSNISAYIYDPFTKIAYNKTLVAVQNIPINAFEDPYIAINSLGTMSNTFKHCVSIESASHGGVWTYGKVYASNDSSFPADPLWRNERILVTNSTEGKNCDNFKGVVVENATDTVSCMNILAYIKGVANAVALSKTDTNAVLSNNTFWLTNDTTCYFEAPNGPSFFDRLEGNHPPYTKYRLPDKITGMGSFIPTFSGGRILDYVYYG